MKQKMRCLTAVLLLFILLLPAVSVKGRAAQAKAQIGLILADKDGRYTFYDFNGSKGEQRIERSESGRIMVPLKLVCSYLPDIDYTFDFQTRQATLINQKNGRKLVFTEKQKTARYYAKGTGRGAEKAMKNPMYLSLDSNAAMVCKDSLKWVMAAGGYAYYSGAALKKAGYDGPYQGIVVYDPYKKARLPKAAQVLAHPVRTEAGVVRVTIPEGYSEPQIFSLLVKKGVCFSTASLFQADQDLDLSPYPVAAAAVRDPKNRCYRLEGYLFPDTYEFYKNSEPKEALGKLLANGEAKWKDLLASGTLEKTGLTAEELVTLASVVEKEAGDPVEAGRVASVFRNRLKQGMRLQSDATIFYVERYIKPYVAGDPDRFSADYNTYKCPALPAGPICSPGLRAVRAALSPEDTPYLYFFTDASGQYHYAETYEEHLENQKTAEGRQP